jgi:diadenosine tetraphosphate (Ap4A) HIT family hydrolase
MECLICDQFIERDRVRGEIIDEIIHIRHGQSNESLLGYFIIEPIRHVERWSDLTSKETIKIMDIIFKLEKKLIKLLPIERLYTVIISEKVKHFHIHLVPRWENSTQVGGELINLVTQDQAIKMNYSQDEMDDFEEVIKNTIIFQLD